MVIPKRTGLLASLMFALAYASPAAETLQDRINAAAPGSSIVVPSGTYEGPLVIDKALSLIGEGFPVIQGRGKGKTVQIIGDHVVLQGFVIRSSGVNLFEDDAGVHITGNEVSIIDNRIEDCLHGIYLKKVSRCVVSGNTIRGKSTISASKTPVSETIITTDPELCDVGLNINERGNGIHLWNSEEDVVEGNSVTDTRDGIYFSFTNHTQVRNNVIRGVRYGLHYMYSDNNTFENNRFSNNAAGAAIMFSKGLVIRDNEFSANEGFRAYGMLLNSVDSTRFENNRMIGNTVGIYLENSNINLFSGNQLRRNYVGLRLTSSSDLNRFTRNSFDGNMHPAELAGQSASNRWSTARTGNYWDVTPVLDLDRDGVGDLPHREPDLLGNLRRPFPVIGLLSGSPALGLLRFAHGRAKLPQVQAIEDPAPLTSRYKP